MEWLRGKIAEARAGHTTEHRGAATGTAVAATEHDYDDDAALVVEAAAGGDEQTTAAVDAAAAGTQEAADRQALLDWLHHHQV